MLSQQDSIQKLNKHNYDKESGISGQPLRLNPQGTQNWYEIRAEVTVNI